MVVPAGSNFCHPAPRQIGVLLSRTGARNNSSPDIRRLVRQYRPDVGTKLQPDHPWVSAGPYLGKAQPPGDHAPVAGFVRERFNQPINPRFVPVYLATIRGEEHLRQARDNAAKILAEEAQVAPWQRKAG